MNNQNKGLLYEKCVKDFIIQQFGINAFLWNECPENILIQNNLIHSHNEMRLIRKGIKEGHLHNHKDIGIDIIQFDNDNAKCSIVQCKNGYNNGLCIDDISGIMSRAAFVRDINTYIYYTSSLSRNLRYISKISPYVVYIDYTNEIDKLKLLEKDNNNKIYFVKLPYKDRNISESINEDIKSVITPYSYQSEAVNKFKEYYLSNNRGILAIPCGCGKTYISSLISIDYKQIVILSPLREFANQNLKRFIEYGYNKKDTLLVDSDGDRDIDSIKNFISKDKFVISCTYKSMDLIAGCLDLFNEVLFIVDEFHNLSKANIFDETDNIYKLLISSHKILFMSATPRIYDFEYDDDYDNEQCFGDLVYQMTFTEAIANKYITDYRIWLPSIHENDEELNKELSIYEIDNEIKNRCKFLYSCIANNGSKKCIIYCKDTEDMNSMIECMKTLNDFYIMDIEMHSISCDDSVKKRGYVLECFTNNEKIQLLFNIRILNECIDIPACDSVYISYAPKNKITTIQRISRSMRIDKRNPYKVANIYIWCEAYEEILETLSSIKEYDIMFKEKVKLSVVDFYNNKGEKELELIEKDKVLLRDCIIGVKEFKVISWEEKLAMVEEYIGVYGKLPTSNNENKNIKQLGKWLGDTKLKYKLKKEIMKKDDIRILWQLFITKYDWLFKTKEELWKIKLDNVISYIEKYNILPSNTDNNKNIQSYGGWISTQKANYIKQKEIMKNINIRILWEEFYNKYIRLFKTNEEIWLDNLHNVKEFIKQNNILPLYFHQDEDIKYLGCWVRNQAKNYERNQYIMKNETNRILWEEFVNDNYLLLRITSEEKWLDNLEIVKDYINKNDKLPTSHNENKNISSLASWVSTQRQNYKKNEEIMRNDNIKKIWEEFVNEYEHLFMSNTEIWLNILHEVKEYINIYKELPSEYSEDTNTQKIARWINTQKKNFKNTSRIMTDENIRELWDDFVNINKNLFRSNEEKWLDNLRELEEYIQTHKKLPNHTNKDENISLLAKWVGHQKRNYVDRNQIMNNDEIRKLWEEIVNKYQEVFKTTEEIWKDNLNNLKEYINIHNKLPTSCNQDETIKSLGLWTRNQKRNFDKKQNIMKNYEIQTLWEEFMKENNKLFLNNEELWIENKHKVEEYIRHHNKLPAQTDKIQDIAVLGNWIQSQKQNYIKKSKIMVNENIRKLWEDFVKKYETLLMTNEEIWMLRYNELNEYINIHNKLPPSRDIDMDSLVQWIRHQKRNYDNRNQIMKNETIRKIWKEFTDNNTALFITTDEIWFENKNKIEEYIREYGRLPTSHNTDKYISSLASWVSTQKQNYKNKEHIMKNNNDIIKEWENFIEKYAILFRTNEEVWMDTLHKVELYIQQYKKRPSASSKDKEISSLGNWISIQKENYKNIEQIMTNEEIRKIWEEIVNKYQEVFMSNDEIWKYYLNSLENYVTENNILPNKQSKILNEKKLGSYVHHQKHNYKNYKGNMKDSSIRKEWEQFTAKYPHLF